MKTVMVMLMAAVMATGMLPGAAKGQAPPVPAEEQPEVLTRGPVHEAFAQPVIVKDQQGLVAPQAPPPDIDEVPPQERPAGDQFVWVPGYWAWDSDRNGFEWVSGCWRAVPPGMTWNPGYWSQTAEGWQWVAGFWSSQDDRQRTYLPAPPALSEVEPSEPSPSPDDIWVPPCWYWRGGQYILRPGYWLAGQADWVWVPSHYVWTPRGYIFAAGHWDYALDRRGILFAPLYFPRPVYTRPGFTYSLSIAVNIGNLQFAMFTRPHYCHYYFGDYYGNAYVRMGIYPWFESRQRRSWYDPIYMHDRWRHRGDRERWERREREEYRRRRDDRAFRPPKTYREMERRLRQVPAAQRGRFEMAESMKRLVGNKKAFYRFERLQPEARRRLSEHTVRVRRFTEERHQRESRHTGREGGQRPMQQVSPLRSRDSAPRVDHRQPEMRQMEPGNRQMERRGPEAQERGFRGQRPNIEREGPIRSRESVPRVDRREPEMRQTQQGTRQPERRRPEAQEPGSRGQRPDIEQEGPRTSSGRERPMDVVPNEGERPSLDRMRVNRSPVGRERRGGFFRGGSPSRPMEENRYQR